MFTRRTIPALALVVVFAVSCNTHDSSFDEVARVPNPSGRVDAVLLEGSGGATTSFGYYVYVVTTGNSVSRRDGSVAKFYDVVRSDSAYGVDLRWESDERLVCDYLRADIVSNTVAVAGAQVVITLRSNITNSAAPSGGMLYNMKKP